MTPPGWLRLATELGTASPEATTAAMEAGTQKRRELKHYSGAMFYYGGEWYWGVDRLYHLEARLAALGADTQPGAPLIAPRPSEDLAGYRDTGQFTLELYASLRSPYTAVIFDRAVAFAQAAGVTLSLRPVLPMVMRGVPATREKGMYIFTDAAREARAAGVPYGNFYDPIGDPARRCYALYPWAESQGKGVELCSSFLRHAFVLGVNTNNDRGLRKVVEAAGLDWSAAQPHREDKTWKPCSRTTARPCMRLGCGVCRVSGYWTRRVSHSSLPGVKTGCGLSPTPCAMRWQRALPLITVTPHCVQLHLPSIGSINANRWPAACVGHSGGVLCARF